ncbi:Ku protein [Streptomyces aurantiacus]|uniref:Non-homologous end joining protein Ku n=1 Tax=Streptomyces aurantiacus JA 4570 TaxID=1286094 RepID=S4A3Z7_9ACTN|nr:Ku protein [Streptomyces aurantiacus]EPH45435.1 putative DNA repair protein [Streptomyces aurantiacus JA 4570]
MRSIWNGAISFGLVSIPIKLVNATENHAISFRQIHVEDGGRIRYRKVCELEDHEVPTAEIGKGYEDADGSVIPITEDDLAALPIPTAKTIEIVAFVPADTIDPLQMDTAYYLTANGVPAAKPYTLLREALKRSQKVAVAKFALRGRERLGMLRVVDDVIAMHGLLWPDEIRATDTVAPDTDVKIRDAELDLADALMDTLGEVDLDSLHDDYREAVEEMITAKLEGGETTAPAPAADEGGGKVIDLMAALESSVRAARSGRGAKAGGKAAEGEDAEVTPLRSRRSGSAKSSASSASSASSSRKSAPAAPKQVGGKKSTAKTAAKSTSAAPKKSTAKKGTAKKSSAKSTTAKKTTTASKASKTATAKKSTTTKKTTTAKKSTTARKKTSA